MRIALYIAAGAGGLMLGSALASRPVRSALMRTGQTTEGRIAHLRRLGLL